MTNLAHSVNSPSLSRSKTFSDCLPFLQPLHYTKLPLLSESCQIDLNFREKYGEWSHVLTLRILSSLAAFSLTVFRLNGAAQKQCYDEIPTAKSCIEKVERTRCPALTYEPPSARECPESFQRLLTRHWIWNIDQQKTVPTVMGVERMKNARQQRETIVDFASRKRKHCLLHIFSMIWKHLFLRTCIFTKL